MVTGVAGFIGFHVGQRLLERGDEVIGIDNLSDYYEVSLKQARLDRLLAHPGFTFQHLDIVERSDMDKVCHRCRPQRVVHLAAQVGVRHSQVNPHAYMHSNLIGFLNVLEACRQLQVEHFVYASSSSVYGARAVAPFSVQDPVDHPLNLYAATKRANELIAHSYSWLYGLPTTGLRLFSVYGPWGRPDMAIFRFTKAILEGSSIDLFDHGTSQRDYTYIDDVADWICHTLGHIPTRNSGWLNERPNPATSAAPFRLVNIGNGTPQQLTKVIRLLEESLGTSAITRLAFKQEGEMPVTHAEVDKPPGSVSLWGPTPLEEGIPRFTAWYRDYYQC